MQHTLQHYLCNNNHTINSAVKGQLPTELITTIKSNAFINYVVMHI